MAQVYIILVNWNGWSDTIECLESIFRNNYLPFQVIVCDNGSTDGSLAHIKAWAEGRLNVYLPQKTRLRSLSWPPVDKPLAYAEYGREEAEKGGITGHESPLVLIDNIDNVGFAGANNVCLRYALARGDCAFVWLLNNDCVIMPDALTRLVARMAENPAAGMCGSSLLHYRQPDKIQALGGGWYCKWLGLPWHLGRLKKSADAINLTQVERWMNYVVGASVLVSRQLLEEVGLMCEDYFLYFEEADWAMRSKGRFSLAYAPLSVVYHKIGSSIGTRTNPAAKSIVCDYFNIRNRIVFTRKFFPEALPTVYLTLLGELFVRLILGRMDRVIMILKLLFGYFTDEKIMCRCQTKI